MRGGIIADELEQVISPQAPEEQKQIDGLRDDVVERAALVPEISDFNVLPDFRRQGIGTALMDEAERVIAARSPVAGVGVGMTRDYGNAQRLYVRRGYAPDGNGLMTHERPVIHGESVVVDDDLVLYLTKRL